MDFFKLYSGSLVALLYGVLFVPIAIPLMKKKIKRNNFYGFRVKYTLQDDDIWYAVNEMLGRQMFYQGLCFLAIGAISYFVVKGIKPQFILMIAVTVFLAIAIIYSLVTGIKLMNKMAEEKGLKK